VNRAPDGTLPIATCLVLLFVPCSHLYPSSSLCWPWPAQGSHTIPLGSSGHRRYAALSDVKPHRTVQRPIRRPATPTSLQASSRWSSQATSSESAGSSSFFRSGLNSPHGCRTYYSLISIGNNINFRVALDTASSDIWVVSSGCSAAQCKSLPRYPLTYNSPTFVSVNSNSTTFNVSFADATCT
jgi:Eukaryotic aspartyl protease